MPQPAPAPRPTRARAALVGPVVALAGVLSACGSAGTDAPEDAQLSEFCTTWEEQFDPEVDGVDDLAAWAEEMAEVGTPEGIDDDARQGFELTIDTAIEAAGSVEVAPGDHEEDSRLRAAFDDYRLEACREY
ncbi:hypothetical protein GCM10023340_01390 [Nocardioides marinquilinus]|uniref:Lipoprotein n=1 Tax=Nocardioides marinquilinus TaxID=1210400 RepID=A0ABP9P5N4_9ACTN